MLAMAILRAISSHDAESLIRNIDKMIQKRCARGFNSVPYPDAKDLVDQIQAKVEAWIDKQDGNV